LYKQLQQWISEEHHSQACKGALKITSIENSDKTKCAKKVPLIAMIKNHDFKEGLEYLLKQKDNFKK
jgi:hypothetical protein